ncbi:hypothetical protein P171DRAFT_478985 [Karstenula rhodostoma CBS 690.94]|uniref:Uncharacterized protein n=1 Tax=Karstenula rhodostoma CBS 690.94 TaxID=1392251 RepID=A0A9P4PXA5_9PLEO|nr:hypothetical protein P171DRAFT_478985 [Karstenula rhodostoma CBS 690.94]
MVYETFLQLQAVGELGSSPDDNTGWRINNIPFDISPGSTDSGTYVNQPWPNRAAGDPSWVAYWADLFISSGTAQGMYCQIDGDEGHRTLSIEYFMSFYGASSAYTHFMVILFEDEIGRVVFSYFQTTSQKASTNTAYGTIGVQRPGTGQHNQCPYDLQPREGLTIIWRPSTNQWT